MRRNTQAGAVDCHTEPWPEVRAQEQGRAWEIEAEDMYCQTFTTSLQLPSTPGYCDSYAHFSDAKQSNLDAVRSSSCNPACSSQSKNVGGWDQLVACYLEQPQQGNPFDQNPASWETVSARTNNHQPSRHEENWPDGAFSGNSEHPNCAGISRESQDIHNSVSWDCDSVHSNASARSFQNGSWDHFLPQTGRSAELQIPPGLGRSWKNEDAGSTQKQCTDAIQPGIPQSRREFPDLSVRRTSRERRNNIPGQRSSKLGRQSARQPPSYVPLTAVNVVSARASVFKSRPLGEIVAEMPWVAASRQDVAVQRVDPSIDACWEDVPTCGKEWVAGLPSQEEVAALQHNQFAEPNYWTDSSEAVM